MIQTITILVLAGIFSGTFSLSMKYNPKWQWENHWLVWSIVATFILPIFIAYITVPDIFSIYAQTSVKVLTITFLLGMLWGVGAIFFGLGLKYLGIGLGMAIMMGLINSLGSLVPMLIQNPEAFSHTEGKALLIASVFFLIGIIFCAVSGNMRQKKQIRKQTDNVNSNKNTFLIGIIIAVFAGILGPMINFTFVIGGSMQDIAKQLYNDNIFTANLIWAIALPGGFVANFGYCIYLLKKNKSYKNFTNTGTTNWLLSLIPGFLWFGSILFYGIAVTKLGKSGASIGWAFFQSLAIVSGNVAGVISGEWNNSGKKPFIINIVGLLFLIVGIIILAYYK